LWTDTWASNSIVQPGITAEGDVLITSQENGTRRIAVAHDASGWSVHERWTSNGLKPYFNDFVVHKGYAYGNGQLVLLPDQDLLLVLSEEGELVLVSATPDQFTERAKVEAIQGKTWNH